MLLHLEPVCYPAVRLSMENTEFTHPTSPHSRMVGLSTTLFPHPTSRICGWRVRAPLISLIRPRRIRAWRVRARSLSQSSASSHLEPICSPTVHSNMESAEFAHPTSAHSRMAGSSNAHFAHLTLAHSLMAGFSNSHLRTRPLRICAWRVQARSLNQSRAFLPLEPVYSPTVHLNMESTEFVQPTSALSRMAGSSNVLFTHLTSALTRMMCSINSRLFTPPRRLCACWVQSRLTSLPDLCAFAYAGFELLSLRSLDLCAYAHDGSSNTYFAHATSNAHPTSALSRKPGSGNAHSATERMSLSRHILLCTFYRFFSHWPRGHGDY